MAATTRNAKCRTVRDDRVEAVERAREKNENSVLNLAPRELSQRLFEETDPVKALKMAVEYSLRVPYDHSRARVWLRRPDRAVVVMPRPKRGSAEHCRATLAFLRDALELVTGSPVQASEERCVRRGDVRCSHQLHWRQSAA